MRLLSNVSSQISTLKVPVSYANTVKALMPIFTVILSRVILGTTHSLQVYLSLIPIVGGKCFTATDVCSYTSMNSICHFSNYLLSICRDVRLLLILGVVVASMTELSFDIIGMWTALLATITFAVQNIFTKKV
jgi:solute carrier family 35, member E1